MEGALKKGRPLPEKFTKRPPIVEGMEFYLRAYNNLSTTRPPGWSGPSPIPWDCIVQYGTHYGLEPDVLEDFIVILREMDEGYLTWWREKNPPPTKPGGGKPPATKPLMGYTQRSRGRQ